VFACVRGLLQERTLINTHTHTHTHTHTQALQEYAHTVLDVGLACNNPYRTLPKRASHATSSTAPTTSTALPPRSRSPVEDLIARVASNIEAYSQDQQQIQERLIYLDKLLAHTGHTRPNSVSGNSVSGSSRAGSRVASMSSGSGRSTPSRSRSVNAGAEGRAGNSGAPDAGAHPGHDKVAQKALTALDAWGKTNNLSPPSSRSGSDVAGDVYGGEFGDAEESEFGTLGHLSRPSSRASRSSFKFDGKPGEKLFGMQLLTEAEIGGYSTPPCLVHTRNPCFECYALCVREREIEMMLPTGLHVAEHKFNFPPISHLTLRVLYSSLISCACCHGYYHASHGSQPESSKSGSLRKQRAPKVREL